MNSSLIAVITGTLLSVAVITALDIAEEVDAKRQTSTGGGSGSSGTDGTPGRDGTSSSNSFSSSTTTSCVNGVCTTTTTTN